MRLQPNLEEVIVRSQQWQDQVKAKFGHIVSQMKIEYHYESYHHFKETFKDLIFKVVQIIHERILVHPFVEQCHAQARYFILAVYKKTLPYLAQISENSFLAAGLGFSLGIVLCWYLLRGYYKRYYGNVIKSRLMSGVAFNDSRLSDFNVSLRQDLIVPKIQCPTEVLIRVHAASVS